MRDAAGGAGGRARRHALNRFYFHEDGRWYFEAREGRQGPFPTREEAVRQLERHKGRHRHDRSKAAPER